MFQSANILTELSCWVVFTVVLYMQLTNIPILVRVYDNNVMPALYSTYELQTLFAF